MKKTIAPFAPLRALRRLALLAAAVLTIGAAGIMPAGAVEPPLGSRNFTPPAYAPDYFSNESEPFHTLPSSPGYFYAAPRYAVPQPRYAAPVRYAAPAAPRYAAYPSSSYYGRASYAAASDYRMRVAAARVVEARRGRQLYRDYRRAPARYAARAEPRRSYVRLVRAVQPVRYSARGQAAVERRVVMHEPRAFVRRIEHRSEALRRRPSGRGGGRAVRGRL